MVGLYHPLFVGKLTLVADLGRFVLESDREMASSLPVEEASLYECIKLEGSNISAYLVDGDFSFSALEDLGSHKAPAPEDAEASSAVSTDMTAAIKQSQGKTTGGSAVFIPLLERCGTSASLQAARFPHPSFPPMKLQLQVPKLRFFFSPARLGRILRAVDAVMPGMSDCLSGILNRLELLPVCWLAVEAVSCSFDSIHIILFLLMTALAII